MTTISKNGKTVEVFKSARNNGYRYHICLFYGENVDIYNRPSCEKSTTTTSAKKAVITINDYLGCEVAMLDKKINDILIMANIAQ